MPGRPAKGKRRPLFILLAALCTSGLMALIVAGYYTVKAYLFHVELSRTASWKGDSFVRDDADLGYVARENASVHQLQPLQFSLYTDNRGGRVEGPDLTAPAKIDVLTVGCSFTWGHGVDNHDTYAAVLKNKTGLVVYNVGIASYGTTTALLSMKRYADLQPTVVVYGFIDDHIPRSLRPTASTICPFIRPVPFVDFDEHDQPYIHPPVGDTKLHDQYIKDVVLDHSFGMKDVSWALYVDFLRLAKRQSAPLLGITDPYVEQKYAHYLESMKSPARQQGMLNFLVAEMTSQARSMNAKLVIVYLPTRVMASSPAVLTTAVEAARAPETLYLVDSSPRLRELAAEKGLDAVFLPNNSHPGPEGHAAIAETLERIVRKLARKQ